MKELTKTELVEINGGNPEAYELGHKVGDFVQEVVRGVLLLRFLFVPWWIGHSLDHQGVSFYNCHEWFFKVSITTKF